MTRDEAVEIVEAAITLLFDESVKDDPDCEVTPVIEDLGALKEQIASGCW